MTEKILLCTVGGSHEPIVKAIKSLSPGYVCFFCTGKDPTSGKPGSESQIVGKGNIIKAHRQDDKPSLPNIPVQANLEEDKFRVCIVPADNLDGAFLTMTWELKRLHKDFPGASIVADYTGGTKTMSAALVCAVLETPDVNLQLVTGSRSNLDRVTSGVEQVSGVRVSRLRFKREMALHLKAWQHFAYREAAEGLDKIDVGLSSPDVPQLNNARILSRAFASWNNFDHAGALKLLQEVDKSRVASAWPWMLRDLKCLSGEGAKRRDAREALCIYDLWRNAERCAHQGRFDDAVARTYRLIEWTAQWQLRGKCGIDTANVPGEKLPPGVDGKPDRDGKIKTGLWEAWRMVAHHLDGPVKKLPDGRLRALLDIRNNSILAHGYKPVQDEDWMKMKTWVDEQFLPVFDGLAQEAGITDPPKQLPQELPETIWSD